MRRALLWLPLPSALGLREAAARTVTRIAMPALALTAEPAVWRPRLSGSPPG